jgi:acyl-coenzyme A synthetase/AMP-(fatty) acid ligase
VLGLVGGLLHGLHAGVAVVLPDRLTAEGIIASVAGDAAPATVIGVPFYAELMASAVNPPPLPQLRRMVVAGELVRPGVPGAFTARFGVPLGTMYGMTEIGVIATDLTGANWPAVEPTFGMLVRVQDGELRIRMSASPYVGLSDPTRFDEGWLRTKDAASIDIETGMVTILGRLDSQISVGGLKVDLTEVEQTLAAMPQVTEVVVIFDGEIEAFVALAEDSTVDSVRSALAQRLAPFKMPRRLTVLPALPRTATGKLVRASTALREASTREGERT